MTGVQCIIIVSLSPAAVVSIKMPVLDQHHQVYYLRSSGLSCIQTQLEKDATEQMSVSWFSKIAPVQASR